MVENGPSCLGIIKIGGQTYVKDLDAFVEATTAARNGQSTPAPRTAKERARQIEAAEKLLDEYGIGGGSKATRKKEKRADLLSILGDGRQ